MSKPTSFTKLVALLQLAYSAEMGAALAYRGHWRSLPQGEEQNHIQQIEAEEWEHRRLIGEILHQLGSKPRRWLEVKFFVIGTFLRFLCHLLGWFLPMYGAGRLESQNYREYLQAASYALECKQREFINCFLSMAEVEWEHEHYFRGKVLGHRWLGYFPLWPPLPSKESIRASFVLQEMLVATAYS
jgi:rubrerythrin